MPPDQWPTQRPTQQCKILHIDALGAILMEQYLNAIDLNNGAFCTPLTMTNTMDIRLLPEDMVQKIGKATQRKKAHWLVEPSPCNNIQPIVGKN